MTQLILLGGGGFAGEVLELARMSGHEVIGYCASEKAALDVPYLGTLEDLRKRDTGVKNLALAIGAVNRITLRTRRQIIETFKGSGFKFPALVSPHAVRSYGVHIGDGAIIAHSVVMSVGARIGSFSILNTSAIVGHDAVVGENSIVAPGAFLGGNARVGTDTLIGPLAKVLQGLQVGTNVVVGVGANVLRHVPNDATVWPRPDKIT